ncbi:hypothetical protein LTR27_009710 [Elasticomyces elasticus]|nr:hypothetical protein LTR27_009710 [Elasticomyces elasticus]
MGGWMRPEDCPGGLNPTNDIPGVKSKGRNESLQSKRSLPEDHAVVSRKRRKVRPSELIRLHGRDAWNGILQQPRNVTLKTLTEQDGPEPQTPRTRSRPSRLIETCGSPTQEKLSRRQSKPARKHQVKRHGGLFSLPAELRIQIYEYVLLDPNKERGVLVTPQLTLPALHSVSRLVRHETTSIYYRGQTFTHEVWDCNADTMLAWCESGIKMGVYTVHDKWRSILTMRGEPNWTNLMRWCKERHEKSGPNVPISEDHTPYETVVVACIRLAREFRDAGRSWKECTDVLDALRRSVGAYENKWLA